MQIRPSASNSQVQPRASMSSSFAKTAQFAVKPSRNVMSVGASDDVAAKVAVRFIACHRRWRQKDSVTTVTTVTGPGSIGGIG